MSIFYDSLTAFSDQLMLRAAGVSHQHVHSPRLLHVRIDHQPQRTLHAMHRVP